MREAGRSGLEMMTKDLAGGLEMGGLKGVEVGVKRWEEE